MANVHTWKATDTDAGPTWNLVCDCGALPNSPLRPSHEKEVTVERPDAAIDDWQTLRRDYLFYVEAELQELKALHAQCPREMSGDKLTTEMEWWDSRVYSWIPALCGSATTNDFTYIVKPRKTQTAEQKLQDAFHNFAVAIDPFIEAAKEAGLLREES